MSTDWPTQRDGAPVVRAGERLGDGRWHRHLRDDGTRRMGVVGDWAPWCCSSWALPGWPGTSMAKGSQRRAGRGFARPRPSDLGRPRHPGGRPVGRVADLASAGELAAACAVRAAGGTPRPHAPSTTARAV